MSEHAPLRVMTWNIHKGIGGLDRRYRPSRIVEVLEHYDADIVLLQEVAQGMPRLRRDDQVTLLLEETSYPHHAFHPEHQFRVGGYGNMILSKHPLHDAAHVDLTIGSRKTRGVVQAHTHVPIGSHTRTLAVHNLHLGLAGSERMRQLARFIDCHPFRQVHAHTPLLVGGDFNDVWGRLGEQCLIPHGLTRAGNPMPTFPAPLPLRPLDSLYFRGDLALMRSYTASTALTRAASDHLPLIADFIVASEGS